MKGGIWTITGLVLWMISINHSHAQTFILQPAKSENSDGVFVAKLLLKRADVFRLDWVAGDGSSINLNGSNSKLIIGRSPNSYSEFEFDVDGTRAEFIPDEIGLSPGRYYARITNSTARTTSEIQDEFTGSPSGIIFSNEIQLIVEASEAPSIIAPRGVTNNPSPTFQWSPVTGVPSYWIIVSSTPFDIIEDENGDVAIEGATIVWQYMTNDNFGVYGDINQLSPFNEEAPPLNSGQEYSYTVLNVYQENNPGFTSPVFGGVIPFTYIDPNAVPTTNLLSPADNEEFFTEEVITFEWEEVAEATNYTVNLYQIVKQQGIDVTLPIYIATTTNTLIEYPAIQNLKNGRYQWNVITNNNVGGGSTSSNRFFSYEVETGEFIARITTGSDGSSLLGVELTARSISGGVSPVIPYYIQAESFTDSLVAGTYEFIAVKDGYEEAAREATILDDRTTDFTINMTALPSSISGKVLDENGEPVVAANVNIESLDEDFSSIIQSNISGDFNFSVEAGTYLIQAIKSGFISSEQVSVSVGVDEQKALDQPITIQNDQASVSGFVFNEDGDPIQRAKVRIEKDELSFEDFTDGNGFYQFTVSSGSWELTTEKIGFIPSDTEIVTLSTGDVVQNIDFVLIGNANQITGFVRERITNEDGSVGTSIFADVTVTAIPTFGEPISTTSAINGQYVLSLRSGSYVISAIQENYSTDEDREIVIGIAVGETISGVDFELIPNPSSISGTVTLPDGNGVSDASIEVVGIGETETSGSGFYSISVPAGTRTVSVNKPGLVTPDSRTVTVSVGQNLAGVDFVMTPNAGSVSGEITSNGQVLSGTTLIAINTTNGNSVEQINESDGSYNFNLSSGSWYIKAIKTGFFSDSTSVITVGPGQQLINQDINLVENLATIRGIVTDGSNPSRNARLDLISDTDPSFDANTITQVNGTYAFSVPANDSYTIRASKSGFKTSTRTQADVVAGESYTVDFELAANPSSISGTVFVNNQSVLGDAKVIAELESGQKVDSANTSTNGEYELGLDPGSYTIIVSKPGYTTQTKQTALSIGENIAGVDFSVDENFAFFSGTISDSGGNPIDQAFINLTKINGEGASTTTDQEGSFSIAGQTAGDFVIEISRTGYITEIVELRVNDGDFIDLERSLIEKNGSISGFVRDENNIALDEATVIVTDNNGLSTSAITDSDGAYSIASLEPSSYTVEASKTGYTSSDPTLTTIELSDLNKTGVNVENLIPNNGIIRGIITESSTNEPIRDVEVSASGERGSGFALSNNAGEFEITNLIPDSYSLVISKDGFREAIQMVTIDPTSPTEVADESLVPNSGRIVGQVVDPNGESLPFRVRVIASSDNATLNVQSDETGNFVFENVETGLDYLIETDIYREGYENTLTTANVPEAEIETTLNEPLAVIVRQANISGNVGTNAASVKLISASTNEIIDLKSSTGDGSYAFDFLQAGRYRLEVSKLGFTFNPVISDVLDLDFDEAIEQNFTAVSNIGSLTISINSGEDPISGASVTLVSTDTTVILAETTNSDGIANFTDIRGNTTYIVNASKDGFTSNPDQLVVTVPIGSEVADSFEFIPNSATVAGTIQSQSNGNQSNLSNASIQAIVIGTGQSFETISNSNGGYTLEELPAGTYQIIGSKEGFQRDTVAIEVSLTEENQPENLLLKNASVDVRGTVRFRGNGVSGVEVRALSTNTFETSTNSVGRFRFANLPVKTAQGDTTTYQIRISAGLFTRAYILNLTSNDIAEIIEVPATNLPSGQILLTITDGVDPLEGAELEFGISGGEATSFVTGNEGTFESENNLRQATYVASAEKSGYLAPENTIRFTLDSDTTILNEEIKLPYLQLPVREILADQQTKVQIVSNTSFDNSAAIGQLFYKTNSQVNFSTVSFNETNDTLLANIPALNSTEAITFFSVIEDTSLDRSFISKQETITPLASGILTNVRINPTLSGQKLRVGDRYQLELFVRDGINESLEDRFKEVDAVGEISWEVSGESNDVELINQQGTTIDLVANTTGRYSLNVQARLEGSNVSETLEFDVVDIPIQSIIVNSPGKQVSNSENQIFSYSAVDTSGNSVLIGGGLVWSVEPSTFGTIDSRGVFTPIDNTILGEFSVSAFDSVSGLSGSSELIELIARIEPDEAYTLSNGQGVVLELPAASVDFPTQVSIRETSPTTSKKFVFAQGSDQSYTVGDRLYVLSLTGSELRNTAQLTLPVDSTISTFQTGDREVGRFNFTTLQWELFDSQVKSTSSSYSNTVGTINTDRLGQFAVLVQNQPIEIRNAAVLPSPFSPDIAPVKIGYWLDTAFPPAVVNIRIYNLRGELVRTLLDNELQQPGRYGSSSSQMEITWDGLTDVGNMARNGRYIIQILAKDQVEEKVKLLQVVLVK